MVEPDVLLPLVVPVVEPEVVPDVVLPLVLPEVLPDVVPVVVLPLVVPEVLPEVDPEVVPDVLPDVLPLVEPAFSEVEHALNVTSDEHSKALVSPVSHLRFIGLEISERRILQPLAPRLYERQGRCLHGFFT